MNIALCICTRNRPEDLRRALASARASSLAPAQVIVSDDSDEAQARETAGLCGALAEVTYTRGPRRGLSANRNHCLDHLAPEVEAVAFIDDDVTVRPDFLARAAREMAAAPPRTLITGREIKNGDDITPHNVSFWGHQEVPPRGPDDYHTIVINTALFPRALFAGARFDEALRYGCEEADICAQAEAQGCRIRFCPDLVNDHHPSPVNRAEYAQVVEASRLYSTFKRYLWLESNPHRALAYGVLAPLHLASSVIKAGHLQDLRAALRAMGAAIAFARIEGTRRRNRNLSPPRLEGTTELSCPKQA